MKLYNQKTKHYSSFSIGKGQFFAGITCRNCTNEFNVGEPQTTQLRDTYLAGQKYEKIVQYHKKNPVKSIQDLQNLISKNPHILTINDMTTTLSNWKSALPKL